MSTQQQAPYNTQRSLKHEDSKELEKLQRQNFQNILTRQNSSYTDQTSYLYPKFLNFIGKICVPCAFCCRCWFENPLYQQQTGSVGLLQRFGKYVRKVEPGLNYVNCLTEKVKTVNLKTFTLNVEQQVITKDNVQLKIETVIFARIFQPADLAYKLGFNINFAYECIIQITKSSVRFLAGNLQLQKIIDSRQLFGENLMSQISRQVQQWGITIDNCNIKQLHLPRDITDSLSQVAQTRRRLQAFLINAKANVQSAKLLKEVSIILDNKASMQIRHLQAIQQILQSQSQNVIFLKTTNPSL